MTTQLRAKLKMQELNDQTIAAYLLEHPEFFNEQDELLYDLRIPHGAGSAISLIERQVHVLRDKNAYFENKLRDMVDAVHENQRLNLSLQRLAVNLFMVDGLDDVIATVIEELRHQLQTDFVGIRLLSNDDELLQQQPQRYMGRHDPRLKDFGKVVDGKSIQCGRISGDQLSTLFIDNAVDVKSAAVVPLALADTFGLLAVGSRDEQHYHPGMGTDYLKQLGDLISAATRQYL